MELSDESWNTPGPSTQVHPKLLASQRFLEQQASKLARKIPKSITNRHENHHNPTHQENSNKSRLEVVPNATYYITKCYLILSIYAKHFIGYYGHPRSYLDRDYFKISGTPAEMHKYTKLTVSTNIFYYLTKAERCLLRHIDHLRSKISLKQQKIAPIELIPLADNHCTLCFKLDHSKPNCRNCSYCSNESHLRKYCPELNPESSITCTSLQTNSQQTNSTNPKYKKYREWRREKRARVREQFTGGIWFKNPNKYHPEMVNRLIPLGIDTLQPTVSLDIEGNGNGGLGNVHISGWFGKILRIQTVYYAEVQDKTVINPNTRITGLQITDLQNGTPFNEVKSKVMNLIRGLRVITQGSGDFEKLDISSEDIKELKINHIDLQRLWPGNQPLGLHYIDAFFYPNHQKLKRESQTNTVFGHSPERDSRVTLKAYMEFIRLQQQSRVPTTEEIREMVKNGLTIKDW